MKRWQGSCLGAFLVLLVGGGSLFFLVPFGGDDRHKFIALQSFDCSSPLPGGYRLLLQRLWAQPHPVLAAGRVITLN
jgi:hypothetical protein